MNINEIIFSLLNGINLNRINSEKYIKYNNEKRKNIKYFKFFILNIFLNNKLNSTNDIKTIRLKVRIVKIKLLKDKYIINNKIKDENNLLVFSFI